MGTLVRKRVNKMMKLLLVLALTCVLYGTSQSAVIKPEIRIIPALALKFDRNVLDGNSDPLSTGGTSGTEGGNDGSSNNDDGGKKKKKGNQGGYKGNKGGKNNWT